MKKLAYSWIAFLLCLCVCAPFCGAAPLWEQDITQTVTEGVRLRRLDRFYANTWDKIQILYVDLDNENIQLRVLTAADGASARETTLSMAQRNGAIAAVNADFFNMTAAPTNMLGMAVQNGALVSSPSKDAGLANFALLEDNTVVMDYFTWACTATSPQGYTAEVYQVNKVPVSTGGITMLTPSWGKTSVGNVNAIAMTDMVVENGIVTQLRVGEGKTAIPENGYILTVNSDINGFLVDNFHIGDPVQLETALTPDIGAIREATGGGTLLVKDGKLAPFTNTVGGYAQRTAVGIDRRGKTLMLVTVDGRQAECEGMTQTELANLLIELGCDTALNLDGGGSTTMVARDRFSGALAVQNTLNASMRPVSTSIGVFSSAPAAEPAGIEVCASAQAVACGDGVSVSYAVYDAHQNNIAVSPDAVRITANRPAVVDGNTVYPSEGGAYDITVSYGDFHKTVTVYSVADYVDLRLYPQTATVKNGSDFAFLVTGTDAYGHTVTVPADFVTWGTDDAVFSVQGGSVRANGSGSGNVHASLGALTAYASVSTPDAPDYNKPCDIAKPHPDYGEGNGYTLYVSGSACDSGTVLKNLFKIKREELLAGADGQAYCLGAYDGARSGVQAIDGFSEQRMNHTLLLTVSNANGGIRNTEQTQWAKLLAAVRGAQEDRIVLLMQNSVYGLESGEKQVLDDILSAAVEKGKSVYLVYEGEETAYTMDKGVTHIVCGALKNAHVQSFFTDLSRFAAVKLTFTPDGVRFCFVN